MGKVVRFTGSKLLGEELRRMRGGRSLDDVVELGKSKLLEFGFKTVAKATLSEIENGRSLPSIESVFALSILYQVPTSRFLHILLEENLIDGQAVPASKEEMNAAYAKALHDRRWTEALAIAIHGIRTASEGWERLRWRMNRALAVDRIGMRWDAISELHACLESAALPKGSVYKVHRELSRMHAAAGQLQMAAVHLDAALGLAAKEDCPAIERCRLLQGRVALVLRRHDAGQFIGGDELGLAEEWVAEGLTLTDDTMVSERLGLVGSRAYLLRLRGDTRAARSQFKLVAAQAREAGLRQREAEALRNLADIARSDDPAAARAYLQRAGELGVECNDIEIAFLSFFELYELAESREQAGHFLRKCRRLYPLVQFSHPSVTKFASLGNSEAP